MRNSLIGICFVLAMAIGSGHCAPEQVQLANGHYRITLETARPGLSGIRNLRMGKHGVIHAPSAAQPIFAVNLREPLPQGTDARAWKLTSRDFTTTRATASRTGQETTLQWNMFWKSGDIRVDVMLSVESDASPESVWGVSIKANRELDADFAFPILDGLTIGPAPERAWYFHPRWAGLLNDVPIDVASTYGQYVRMQVMAVSNPSGAGVGKPSVVYVVTRDTTMARKTFELVKRVPGVAPVELRDDYGFPFWSGFQAREGAGMAVNWTRIALQAGKSHVVPPVVIGIGAGDWRDALTSYQVWARTWCPIHERSARESFKHCFYRIFTQPDCDTALAELDRSTYPDYLQFMVQKVHLNGNYGYREDWGLPQIQRFVRECRKRGIVTNHYVEGYIAHNTSGIWKEKGNEWGQMAGGKFQTAWANQCMWLGEPGWHGWLAGETSRLARDLGLDSIYLDEIGFGTGDKSFSANPHHNPGRLQPDGAMTGVRALLRTVRKSLDEVDSGISIYTEGPAVDCLFPYLDGVEDYGCRQWTSLPKAYRIPVHFLRFVFPDMKFADIPEDTGEAVDRQVRMCLFNGIGTFTRLAATDAASWIERVHVVERDNRDAFNDRNPTPLVPTLAEGVYCNRFSSPAKTVFTVFNANEYRASGQLLDLPVAKPGHHWVDLLHGSELRTDAGRWGTRAVLDLEPGDVAAIARFPVLIAVRADGDRMRLTAPKLAAGEKMVLTLVGGDGIVRKQEPMEAKPDGFSLAGVTEKGKYRAVLKLYREGVLLDMLELPGA